MTKQRLSGWGRTAWTVADTVVPADENEVRTVVGSAGDRGVIARGLGRSYGAAAQNAGGQVLMMPGTAVGRPYSLDTSTGTVTAPAGMRELRTPPFPVSEPPLLPQQ